ncbi:HD domain-containing phosphohydrolase [Azospirillum picis]|uniref:Two-component system response regulator n=1 Tax=Azospirillum picis TaxID=488438 RepID=A0ABU0MDG7_9PROT|nr:HD domain-containing phosphohydrolase [Azospirillum picis]MBP2297523.1 putative two-component system response regulator [Azospirillum picis]MDQ0531454.1 putative two-component system response regulator [Azospirillum picis]
MKVLVVDDDQTNLFIMAAIVRRLDDADPVTMTSPVKAIDWMRENEPDLVLLDQMMPDMDGIELLRRIRGDARLDEVPVVMVTANTAADVRMRALDLGCSDFLTKPIVVPEVQVRLRNLLALRHGRTLLRDRAALLAAEVERVTAALQRRGEDLVHRLSRAAEYRDPETGAHIERMALYSRLIAEAAGCGDDFAHDLQKAAPMHDIGKIGIPDMILLKPGQLTPEETRVMRRHTTIGHRILADSDIPLLRMAAEIALTHHEKFDGSGYPAGRIGNAIPLCGRIVAIADVFDALTSARPYKRPWTLTEARAFMIEQRGLHFDPALLDAFLSRWDDILSIHSTHADHPAQLCPMGT